MSFPLTGYKAEVARRRPCPKCSARRAQPCQTKAGTDMVGVHRERA